MTEDQLPATPSTESNYDPFLVITNRQWRSEDSRIGGRGASTFFGPKVLTGKNKLIVSNPLKQSGAFSSIYATTQTPNYSPVFNESHDRYRFE